MLTQLAARDILEERKARECGGYARGTRTLGRERLKERERGREIIEIERERGRERGAHRDADKPLKGSDRQITRHNHALHLERRG